MLIQSDAPISVDRNHHSMSLSRRHVSVGPKEAFWCSQKSGRRFVDGCPRASSQAAFCARVGGCARRPADSGTSTECLPFPQPFDVTRSCCDNEPCALPQGEHPVVSPGLCQSCGPAHIAPPHTHTLRTQQWKTLALHLDGMKMLASFM